MELETGDSRVVVTNEGLAVAWDIRDLSVSESGLDVVKRRTSIVED